METEDKKSKNELLKEEMFLNKKNSWLVYNEAEKSQIFRYADNYKQFLNKSKTERACIRSILTLLKEQGFKEITTIKSVKTGDKLYKNIKDKVVFAAIIGKDTSKIQLVGSHVDSPRLDLKPSPVYQEANLALFKTHYYGGIKKYHWVNTPLSLQGVVFTKSGKKIFLSIGERADEPKFIIPDLLPHLDKNQMERKAEKIIEAEELNILVGNIPVDDKKIEAQIKFEVLKYLKDTYGIVEEDFFSAELELVPSGNALDIGFDRSLVAAYGQDDKVCVYTSLMALLEVKNPAHIAVGLFVDKEEIGSTGDTGAGGNILFNFATDLLALLGTKIAVTTFLENSNAVSADVTGAFDPNHADVFDGNNSSFLGKGLSIEKYGGGGGKSYTNDASAEYVSYIRKLADDNKIPWQTGELGKMDIGGGGTIGMYLAKFGLNCIDLGPSVLGMHSPYEVTSKVDIFSAYKFYKVFFVD